MGKAAGVERPITGGAYIRGEGGGGGVERPITGGAYICGEGGGVERPITGGAYIRGEGEGGRKTYNRGGLVSCSLRYITFHCVSPFEFKESGNFAFYYFWAETFINAPL